MNEHKLTTAISAANQIMHPDLQTNFLAFSHVPFFGCECSRLRQNGPTVASCQTQKAQE